MHGGHVRCGHVLVNGAAPARAAQAAVQRQPAPVLGNVTHQRRGLGGKRGALMEGEGNKGQGGGKVKLAPYQLWQQQQRQQQQKAQPTNRQDSTPKLSPQRQWQWRHLYHQQSTAQGASSVVGQGAVMQNKLCLGGGCYSPSKSAGFVPLHITGVEGQLEGVGCKGTSPPHSSVAQQR